AFQVNRPLAVLATSGIIFAAVYMLWMYQRVFFGGVRHEANRGLRDLGARELLTLAPVLLLILWIGVYPKPFTAVTESSVAELVGVVKAKAGPTVGAWWHP